MCAIFVPQWDGKFRKPNRHREYRKRKRTKHHLLPRSRGGTSSPENILVLWNNRHEAYHEFFGNATISEAIAILYRIKRAKKL